MNANRHEPVDPDEVEGFECEAVDMELAGILGSSLAPLEPSAGFKEALFARLDEVEQISEEALATVSSDIRSSSSSTGGKARGEQEPLAQVLPLRNRLRPWLVRTTAAAALLVVGIGIGRASAITDMSQEHSYAMLNQSQDVERSTDTMPDGHIATLTWSSEMGKAAVTLPSQMSEGMTEPSSTKVLQVWVRDAQGVRSAGVYSPSRGMDFAFIDLMPEDGDEIFVTIEPAGGSQAPSGEALVAMRVGASSFAGDEGGTEDGARTEDGDGAEEGDTSGAVEGAQKGTRAALDS
ncbi:anti-sigma factor [Schaalia cardiffensis]|uniref:anti-sigma factor n=1 Tax=Schaalia cardiffensis TaxID=181487 RepID=UPI001E472EA4|nr:anti-sigma factor [Schaalia cardiffensis]